MTRALAGAVVLGVLALLTACGASSSNQKAASTGQDQARRYAQCIRDNGVPDFPDPDANGQFRGAGHEQQSNPKFQAAAQTCQTKLPGGGAHQGP